MRISPPRISSPRAAPRSARCRWSDRSTRWRRSPIRCSVTAWRAAIRWRDRVILWTRVTPKRRCGGAERCRGSWRATTKFAQVVARGETADRRRARLHGEGRRDRASSRATTYYYRFAGEQASDRRSAARKRCRAPASSRVRLGVVSCSNLPQGYFNAYACLANARPRRGAAPRRLPLRVSPTSSTATAPRSDAFRRRTRKWSRCRIIASVTRSTRPIRIHRRSIASIRSSSPGTITSSPTTPGGAAPRTTRRRREGDWIIAARRGAAGLLRVDADPRGRADADSRASIARSASATWRRCSCSTRAWSDAIRKSIARISRRIESPARRCSARRRKTGSPSSCRRRCRSNSALERARTAGDVRAADGAGHRRPQTPTRGTAIARARDRVFDMIERAKVDNLAVLTGDVHSSWAYDLPRDPFDGYDKATGKGSLGVEFAGTSVTSPSNLGAGPMARSSSPACWRLGRICITSTAATAATSSSTSRVSGCRPISTAVATVAGAQHEGTFREGIHHGIRPKPSD